MVTEKVQQRVDETLCKDCIKKLSDQIGEDIGFSEAGEFYNTFRMDFASEWIDELAKGKIDHGRLHFLISVYSQMIDYENYYKYAIEWLIKTDPRCVNEEIFEAFLVSKSGLDFREPKINILDFFNEKIN